MTRPTVGELRERGLLCQGVKRTGEPCCYKKRPGHDFCCRHGAPSPPRSPPRTPPRSTCECPICYEVKPAKVLTCNHAVCDDCHAQWFANNRTCPLCRAEVIAPPKLTKKDVQRNNLYRRIQNIIDDTIDIYTVHGDDNSRAAVAFLDIMMSSNEIRAARRLFV